MGIAERKSRQKHALRERILDAARRIVMREGFAALSMRKIADAIEYSPATLYLHFASRDEIAHALCEEGFAQLLKTFEPLAVIADPAERLKAFGRAYVAFGVAHPQTYQLIFMEDPSYTGAAFGGAGKARAPSGEGAEEARLEVSNVLAEPDAVAQATTLPLADQDDAGAAALHIMIAALDELKAAGRLPVSTDAGVWAEAFWATMHGVVALNLTCPVFPSAPLDTIVDVALEAWLGAAAAERAMPAGKRTTRPKSGAHDSVAPEDGAQGTPAASADSTASTREKVETLPSARRNSAKRASKPTAK